MRIVIAEDAALFRAGLTRLLEDEGHQVCAADGAAALLAAADEHHPDVVIADIRLPPACTDQGAPGRGRPAPGPSGYRPGAGPVTVHRDRVRGPLLSASPSGAGTRSRTGSPTWTSSPTP